MADDNGTLEDHSLFVSEEQVLEEAATMLRDLDEVANGVHKLTQAYNQGYQEQKRLLSLSDRMQLTLHTANRRLTEQAHVLERMNQRLRFEMAERERLAQEQERFFQMVSHEFSTPLSTIDAGVEILRALDSDRDPQGEQGLQRIQAATQRLAALIENCLTESRLSGKKQLQAQIATIAPKSLLSDAIADARSIWPQHRFEIQSANLPASLEADPELLRILLCNLLDNAAKYGPIDSLITLHARSQGEHLELEVEDQGPGIDVEERKRLCQRFQRGEKTYDTPGFGLGLHLVLQVASLHQGSVELNEAANGGLRVSCRLPLRALEPARR